MKIIATVAVGVALATLVRFDRLVHADEKPDFAKATAKCDDPPLEKSNNGKNIKKMKEEVEKLWDTIVFEKDGKPVLYEAVMETEHGTVEIAFFPQYAPNHVRNFICLAKVGFYDDLAFHRVVKGQAVQGGCPKGDGSGGPGYCLKAEFNEVAHTRGVLSMARSSGHDTAGCQFFFVMGDVPRWDGGYTAFGKIIKGIEAVEKIEKSELTGPQKDLLKTQVKIKSVKIRIKGE